jgi:hypothetical protein
MRKWERALAKHLEKLEKADDIVEIGKTAVALHRASLWIQSWLARAAAEAGVPPPAAVTSAPAQATSDIPTAQEAAS